MTEALGALLFGPEPIAWIQQWIGPGHPLPFRIFSLLGDTWGIVWVTGLSLWLFGRAALHAVLGIVGVGALTKLVLSGIFEHARPRGPGIVVYDRLDLSSFPSGHVYEAVGPWGLLYALGHLPFWIPALVALLVAMGRLYLGTHFLGDVLAGIVLGALLVWAFTRAWPAVHRWLAKRGAVFFVVSALVAIAVAALRLPVYGSDLRRFEVLGLVVGGALSLRHLRSEPDLVARGQRILAVFVGTAGVAGLLLVERSLPSGASLVASGTAALAVAWALVLTPLLVGRVTSGSHGARHPGAPGPTDDGRPPGGSGKWT